MFHHKIPKNIIQKSYVSLFDKFADISIEIDDIATQKSSVTSICGRLYISQGNTDEIVRMFAQFLHQRDITIVNTNINTSYEDDETNVVVLWDVKFPFDSLDWRLKLIITEECDIYKSLVWFDNVCCTSFDIHEFCIKIDSGRKIIIDGYESYDPRYDDSTYTNNMVQELFKRCKFLNSNYSNYSNYIVQEAYERSTITRLLSYFYE
ncbi:hypothetical protein PBCVNEJV4_261R [Paramecium bursaria Chlorella virus NE-JV-4]|nr:hypothetical protein PBCVNEJV4_261R [Paramecium bursaria Chlorella virus NE-JV-4]